MKDKMKKKKFWTWKRILQLILVLPVCFTLFQTIYFYIEFSYTYPGWALVYMVGFVILMYWALRGHSEIMKEMRK